MQLGEKIRRLRMRHALTQEELATRCNLSKGFISQLERDLTSPSIATLADILECLGTDLRSFFNEREQEKVVFEKEDIFETGENGQTISWLIPNAQKNEMEPILLQLDSECSTEADDPHEGEEFGYVLAGQIELVLGEKAYKVHRGASFYFASTAPHFLRNPGKTTARVLWISSPPSF